MVPLKYFDTISNFISPLALPVIGVNVIKKYVHKSLFSFNLMIILTVNGTKYNLGTLTFTRNKQQDLSGFTQKQGVISNFHSNIKRI